MSVTSSGNAASGNQASTTATANGSGDAQSVRNQGRRNRGNRFRNDRGRNQANRTGTKSSFRGETPGLNGNVFQTLAESHDPTQFKCTMEALERFSNKVYQVDLGTLFDENIRVPVPIRPTRKTGKEADELEAEEYREEVKEYVKEKKNLNKALRSLFSVVWGQCSVSVTTRLLALEELQGWKELGKVDELLKSIRQAMMSHQHQRCAYVTLFKELRTFYSYRQREHQTLHKYLEVFQVQVENIKRYGGSFGDQKVYIKELMDRDGLKYLETGMDETVLENYAQQSRQKFMAIAFLLGGRVDLYGDLFTDLENDYLKGRDFFPDTITDAYNLMSNYVQRKALGHTARAPVKQNGLGFLQAKGKDTKNSTSAVPGTDGVLHERIQCFNCGQKGHYSNKCPVTLLQEAAEPANHVIANDSDDGKHPDLENLMSPTNDYMGFGFVQVSLFQSGARVSGIHKDWVLLDTQSNCDIFMNPSLLRNIRNNPTGSLVLQSNGGEMEASQVGDIPGYGQVWFNSDSMANILSFANVRKKCKITMETGPGDSSPTIVVHRKSGGPMLFKEHKLGLYVHNTGDTTSSSSDKLNNNCDYLFLTTVQQLESTFTKDEVQKAKNVLSLSRKLGYPSVAVLKDHILHNKIRGCTLSYADFKRSNYLYGTRSEAVLKGKTVRVNPSIMPSYESIPLPDHIRAEHHSVVLFIDIFYVHGISFFHSISKHYKFRTVELIHAHTTRNMLDCLQNVINTYNARDLTVSHVYGDSEFLPLSPSILPTLFHPCGKGDHVPTVERSIRTVKERCRSVVQGLPYTHYTRLMIKSLVYFVVSRLNAFPCTPGLHVLHSPLTLVTGKSPPTFQQMGLEFGEYVQMHDNTNHSRTTMARTTGGIALQPANSHRSWFFLSLTTGKRVMRSRWTTCTITNDVIHRIKALAEDSPPLLDNLLTDSEGALEQQSELENQTEPVPKPANEDVEINVDVRGNEELNVDPDNAEEHNVENEEINADPDNLVTDNEEDSEDEPTDDVGEEERIGLEEQRNTAADDVGEEERVGLEEQRNVEAERLESEEVQVGPAEEESSVRESEILNQPERFGTSNETRNEEQSNPKEDDVPVVEKNRSEDADSTQFKSKVPVEADDEDKKKNELQQGINRYNLRKKIRKAKESRFNKTNYTYLTLKRNAAEEKRKVKLFEEYQQGLMNLMQTSKHTGTYDREVFHHCAVGACMTQMSARQGIKTYGNRAIDAMAKEYSQLESLKVFAPVYKRNLTPKVRRNALQVIDLIKEKRCGRIKGRTVVDGRGQRGNYTKSETSSSALTLEAFVATLAVDALERRDVAVADIAGAFLKAEQPDYVVIKMRGPAVTAILQVNAQKYKKYVVLEKNEKVMYLRLLKAMYGTLTAPLLWYKLFARTLLDLGFVINRYDPCVANKIVNGTQFTICWYVDDLKLSHVQPEEVTKMLDILNNKFDQMSITRGKKHTYLGMNFEIREGKVFLEMASYLSECIKSFGESITSSAASPANKSLMTINENSEKLNDEKREIFHHVVQKLLHICKRTRLDLQVVIGFLCTRVRNPSVQDWLKLRRVLQYVHGTLNLKRVVSIDNFGRIDVFVDASHGAHADYRGQTGGCMKMGNGILHGRSSKQSLNSKSSTETELIGVSDYMPYPIWMLNFYKEQGYEIGKLVLQQDNESTIKMLTNGRQSCGPKSRHIGIRYFWCTDRLKTMKAEIVHCPTAIMLADFFTKPLQGSLFRTMRDVVHGLMPYDVFIEESMKKDAISNVVGKLEMMNASKNEKENSTDQEERVGERKTNASSKLNVKRVRFIDGVEKPKLKTIRTYAEAVKSRTNQ